ncbi:hypothetical protein [Bradyrhizobium sp. Ec3.3]|uniref:hypothetical protein n=1 Tax=Bradyrhizobium sp. Ec3.3 TaxID=189753 RepID=UPI000416D418|nr:hypothetical protein [Bradyrhizobium sp. Ec3.3]
MVMWKIITRAAMVATVMVIIAAAEAKADGGASAGAAVGTWVLERMKANSESAKDESTVLGKIVKPGTGISVDAIREHGILGGPNSVLRKPLGTLFK